MNKLKNYEYPSFVIVVHSCRLTEKICFMTKWKKTDPASGQGEGVSAGARHRKAIFVKELLRKPVPKCPEEVES